MNSTLPTILCIHGHGTSGTIFSLQARRIVQHLKHAFCFTFVDAPFDSLPGPGVLPVFEDCKPFLRWHCDQNALEKFDLTPEELVEERQATREMLAKHIREDKNIVGIMAFSQGTRVATGLLLDAATLGLQVKFALLICGTFPALPITLEQDSQRTTANKLRIPSIHVQASQDPWRAEGQQLMDTYFDPSMAKTFKFRGGHQVPNGNFDAQQVAKLVLEVYNA